MRLKIPLSRYLTRIAKANAPKTMFTAGSIQSDMGVLRADSSMLSRVKPTSEIDEHRKLFLVLYDIWVVL
jgi:hypothetical protein